MPTDVRPLADRHVGVDRVLDLVHGLLAPAEARAAVDHIGRCAMCERDLREQAGTLERARAVAFSVLQTTALRIPDDVLGPWPAPPMLRAVPPVPAPAVRARRIERVMPWAVGLASAACVLAALLLPSQPLGHRAGPRPWLPGPGDQIIVRDGSGSASTGLRDGLLAYADRDLAAAERLLESAAAPGAGDQLRRLYLADVMLRTGRADAALEQLQSLRLFTLPEPWNEEARWMLLAAFQATGDRSRADSLQRALAAKPGG